MNFQNIIKKQSDEIQSLKSELITFKTRCEQYEQAYESLTHQMAELIRNRFGRKSERYIDPESKQLSLFPEDNGLFAYAEDNGNKIPEEDIAVAAHSRKKKAKGNKELPRRIEIIPVGEEDMKCDCGSCKTVISYESKELLHYQPAILEIIEQRREIATCLHCQSGMVTAPAPLQILPKIKATEELLAFLVVSKLEDRQPLYHLEKQLAARYGIDCSRQTMARWLIGLISPLQPLFNLLKDQVIEYDVASCDATTLQVLKEPGREATTKSYVYCIRGGPPQSGVILYSYNDKLHKQFINDWFEGFTGYLHVDGDKFFDLIGKILKLVNCNGHARRKFEPIALSDKKGKGLAKEAMRFFRALYKIERDATNNNLMPEQRYKLRQEQAKPLLDKFKRWLDEVHPTVLPQSPLGKAINYCLKIWDGLTRYLEDGRLEIDNNATEREIKPLVIARKNFLFAASVDGANALCMHFSLIRTAKLHGLEPYHYYVKLLKSIPHCTSVEDYEQLLPWNIKLDYASSG